MIEFYDINNFLCKYCNCNEYDVVSTDPLMIVCSKCGKEITKNQYEQLEIREL